MSDSEPPSLLEQLGMTGSDPATAAPPAMNSTDEAQAGAETDPATSDGDGDDSGTDESGADESGTDESGAGPRRGRRKWPFVVAAVLVLIVAGAVGLWQLRAANSSAASGSRTRAYTVSSQTLKQTVGSTGTIEPAKQSDLSFSSSGTVTSVDVAVGDKVTKGDALAAIDDTSLKADVNSAKAAVDAAEDDLTALADADDSTTAAITNAKAQLTLKKSELANAKDALSAATLTAPFSGVVAEVGIAEGDTTGSSNSSTGSSSTGSSSTGGSTTSGSGSSGSSSGGSGSSGNSGASSSAASSTDAITVISDTSWIVDTSVSSADLASVKTGLQAQITPTSGGDTIYGTVSSVGVMASSDSSGSSTFPVTIKVTGSPKDLYAGTSASVSIIVKQIQNALVVPTAAVKTANGNTVVEKVVNNKDVQTKITIGDSYGAQTIVKSGLSAGDQVSISIPGAATGRSGSSSSRSGSQSAGTGGGEMPGGSFPGGGGGFGGGQGNR